MDLAARHRGQDVRFDFPAWEQRCGGVTVATRRDPETLLLRTKGHGCRFELRRTAPETTGQIISSVALLLLVAFTVLKVNNRNS